MKKALFMIALIAAIIFSGVQSNQAEAEAGGRQPQGFEAGAVFERALFYGIRIHAFSLPKERCLLPLNGNVTPFHEIVKRRFCVIILILRHLISLL